MNKSHPPLLFFTLHHCLFQNTHSHGGSKFQPLLCTDALAISPLLVIESRMWIFHVLKCIFDIMNVFYFLLASYSQCADWGELTATPRDCSFCVTLFTFLHCVSDIPVSSIFFLSVLIPLISLNFQMSLFSHQFFYLIHNWSLCSDSFLPHGHLYFYHHRSQSFKHMPNSHCGQEGCENSHRVRKHEFASTT